MDIISYLLGKNAGGGDPHEAEYTAAAYNVCEEKGAEMPEEQTLENLADCIDTIPGAEVIPPDAGVLESIVVGALPTKTTYIEGEPLDLTGLIILANFSNGYQYDVTQRCTFICNDPVTYYDTKITAKYVVLDLEKTIDIPITVNGVPVQAPAETKGLWHFDAGTDKNEVNGKGTSTSGLVNPQNVQTSIGVFGTVGCKNSTNMWLSYNNTLSLTNYAVGTIPSSDFTCEFWFYPTSGNYFNLFMSKATNYSTEIGLKVGSNGALSLNGSSNWLPSATFDTSITAPLNSWHHFAFVNNHATRKVYIDGKLWATSTASPSTDLGLAYMYVMTGNSNYGFFDEVLFTENAKYLTNFEPPHAEYYLAGGE